RAWTSRTTTTSSSSSSRSLAAVSASYRPRRSTNELTWRRAMRVKSSGLFGVSAAMALAGLSATASAQQDAARGLLESAAAAMGGLERLQSLESFALTGWGQQLYFEGGGNVSPDPNAPPKWRAVADAQRTFDLRNERAVNQERRSYMFPFAAPFGHSWARTDTLQTGADILDHPLPALLEALDPETTLGAVTVEDGLSV